MVCPSEYFSLKKEWKKENICCCFSIEFFITSASLYFYDVVNKRFSHKFSSVGSI